ncbi:MAG TPA: hypothetical protein VKF79_11265 [Candidatus Acidoferrum sp.]|nr:hypothetical protein [Candidatus Acidoferrum sp.]
MERGANHRTSIFNVYGIAVLRRLWLLSMVYSALACSHPPARSGASAGESGTSPAAPETVVPPVANSSQPVTAQMHNVIFHFSEAAAAHIESLDGQLIPTAGNSMPVFDDKTSFVMRVHSARVTISTAALASIMNNYVFAKPDAPLKELSVYIDGDHLHVKGKLHSKGDVSFETVGALRTTSDGRIRFQSERVKAFHLPVKGIMNLFGMDLAKVLNTVKIPGIETDKDDVLLDLSKLLPPPHIQGPVTGARIENNEIVTIFGGVESAPTLEKGNYVAFRGGQVRFGKITMEDADISVLDLDPGDPLDWFQDRYKEQLAAGYSKITPTFGLRAYVKDYNKLVRPARKN